MHASARDRTLRYILAAVLVLSAALLGAAVVAGRPSEPLGARTDALVNLDGEPVPERDPSRLRLLVADLGMLAGSSESGWPPREVVDARLESIAERVRAFRPDVAVLYDVPFDGARYRDLDAAERLAVAGGLHYRVEQVSLSRRYALSPRRGLRPLGGVAAGPLLLSRWPLGEPSGGPVSGARTTPWGALGSRTEVDVEAGPAWSFALSVADGLGARGSGLRVTRGGNAGGSSAASGQLALALPGGWEILRSRTDDTFDGHLPVAALKLEIELPSAAADPVTR